jgi:putative selenate reductase molybdopterin-binding subunit
MLRVSNPEQLFIKDRKIIAPDKSTVTMEEVALSSLHQLDQHQIMATESHISYVSPPPTASQFAEVSINSDTGEIIVDRLLMIVDCGRVINPITAAGQVEGGNAQALGLTLYEDTILDEKGRILNDKLSTYKMLKADEMPPMDVIFVQTDEPTGPYGAKSVAEIAIDGVAPAIISAVHDAVGIWFHKLPLTQETLAAALKTKNA